MKRNFKTILILATVFLALLVTACGGAVAEDPSRIEAKPGHVQVQYQCEGEAVTQVNIPISKVSMRLQTSCSTEVYILNSTQRIVQSTVPDRVESVSICLDGCKYQNKTISLPPGNEGSFSAKRGDSFLLVLKVQSGELEVPEYARVDAVMSLVYDETLIFEGRFLYHDNYDAELSPGILGIIIPKESLDNMNVSTKFESYGQSCYDSTDTRYDIGYVGNIVYTPIYTSTENTAFQAECREKLTPKPVEVYVVSASQLSGGRYNIEFHAETWQVQIEFHN